MKPFPKVFIIILNFNGRDCVERTLQGVLKENYPNFEVVFVDNHSQDGSFEAAKRKYPRLTFIRNEENLGFSAGNNVGIKYALERGADYVLLLNYDVSVQKNFLMPLVEAAEKYPSVGITSPLILTNGASEIWFSGGRIRWFRMRTEQFQKNRTEDFFESEYLSGCAMLIRASVFKKIGLFDEAYFLYWEDVDFCTRAKTAGFELLLVPKSRIIHWEKSQEDRENKVYWLVLSGLLFFQKNAPFWLRPWHNIFVYLRKIKNRRDISRNINNSIAKAVQKAYRDFKYVP